MAIWGRTEKAIMRAMCGVKLIEKRRSQELMCLLGLEDTLDGLARASGVQWYGKKVFTINCKTKFFCETRILYKLQGHHFGNHWSLHGWMKRFNA